MLNGKEVSVIIFSTGRFQMQVLARCGHAVHEDRPHEVAEVISGYLIRNRFAEAVGEFHFHLPSC